jgi:FkbM family methyltransferase
VVQINAILKRLSQSESVRRTLIPIFRLLNPRDVCIRHHWTCDRMVVHSFRHKGYWFHGRDRERNSMALCAKLIRQGDIVFDVGGHIGYMALYFATLAGSRGNTFTFEPSPQNLRYIRANVTHTNWTNITLIESAVGAQNGMTTFWSEELTGQNGSIVPDYGGVASTAKSHGVRAQTLAVPINVTSLDTFAAARGLSPGFVKIDVEGAESLVLRGMSTILAACRPRIMIEVTNEGEAVLGMLSSANYFVFDEKQRRLGHYYRSPDVGPNLFAVHAEDNEGLRTMNRHG